MRAAGLLFLGLHTLPSCEGTQSQIRLSQNENSFQILRNNVSDNVTCVNVNSTLMSNCAPYVDYLIPSSYNQSTEDQLAFSFTQDTSQCPYYTPLAYQCRKHFPSCSTVENTNGTTTAVLLKVCTSSCYAATTWMNGICQRFSDEYFSNECEEDRYYANTNPPLCQLNNTPLPSQSWWWKIVLVGLLGLIGLILLGSYIRTRWRERMTPEDLDREDERRAARRAAAHAPKGRRFVKGRGEAYLPLNDNETEMEPVSTVDTSDDSALRTTSPSLTAHIPSSLLSPSSSSSSSTTADSASPIASSTS